MSILSQTRVGTGLRGWRVGVAFLGVAVVFSGWGAARLEAQQWRARISSRVQYVEGRTLLLDSVQADRPDANFATCQTGQEYCYLHRSGPVLKSYPAVLDVDLNVFGFGIEGLRAYVSTRFRTDFGNDEFWPRVNDNFDLLAGYLEWNKPSFRLRAGRDYQVSGLGYYGYDGGSAIFRYRPWNVNIEAYGGWGLARGVPEPVNGDAFNSLGAFKATERNLLFGFRGDWRPTRSSAIEAIYQREIPTDRSGIATERLGFEASWNPTRRWSLSGHADYNLAVGEWGKAGVNVGVWAHSLVYLEGKYIHYRPTFSLFTIWEAFSPVAYNGWNVGIGLPVRHDLDFKLWAERRQYEETGADSSIFPTTDRDWRVGGRVGWRPRAWGVLWDIDGGYWINWGFGAALNSGDLRIGLRPHDQLSAGLRLTGFQQIEEFRVGEGRVWSVGGDVRWRTRAGTVWFSVDRYDHDRRINGDIEDDPTQPDWTQWRAAFGFSYYVGSEPGRAP